jgi:DNA invertase Pin-like site-specific DNA recombinase
MLSSLLDLHVVLNICQRFQPFFVGHLQRLSSYGVAFHSYTEPHLATDNELVRNILLALLSSLAKAEAKKISERTRAGMSRAKAKGVKIGRPKIAAELRHQITRLAAEGQTAYAIAKALHIDRHTAAKYLQRRTHDRTRPMLQQRQKVLATCGLAELIEHSVSPSLVCS